MFIGLFHCSCVQIVATWRSPAAVHKKKSLSLTELSELLAYEELEDDADNIAESSRKKRRSMHHQIPTNPFRATIRVHRQGSSSECGEDNMAALDDLTAYYEADSPVSFPPTPFSRARVMGRSAERVDTIMFAARDRLRLQAQSASRDAYSRQMAQEIESTGLFATFDPQYTSGGLALSCGNHCVMKVGNGLCCSARSVVSIDREKFVYLEFSITASSGQVPSLAIGLCPIDCPLNVMVREHLPYDRHHSRIALLSHPITVFLYWECRWGLGRDRSECTATENSWRAVDGLKLSNLFAAAVQ